MNNKKLQVFLLLLLGMSSITATAQDRVGDFALLDAGGYFHHMSWYENHEAIVFLVQANGDPEVQAALPEFRKLAERFADQDLQFFLLNPMANYNRDAVAAEMQRFGVDIPVLMDDSQLVAETLGISRTAEVLIYDPRGFSVGYRGSVSDELEAALSAAARGTALPTASIASKGSQITYSARDAHKQAVPS